jgi:hypothetical protein
MKRYDGGEAVERWKADVQMLLSSKYVDHIELPRCVSYRFRNPFMPVLVGVSDEKTPVRFLLLVDRP